MFQYSEKPSFPLTGELALSQTSVASTHETEQEGIRVARATPDDLDRWDDLGRESPRGTPFHKTAALAVIADHSGTTVHPLIGFKGQEPIGLFPTFVYQKAGIPAAFSPPPSLWLPYLGPVLCNSEGMKRLRAEKRHRRFVEAALSWMDDVIAPRYVHLRTTPKYPDSRPFGWNGFDVTPRYTYHVDLALGEEALLERFNKRARRNVTDEHEGVSVRLGGRSEVADIFRQVRNRFAEQGEYFGVPTEFGTALYDRLPDGAVRPYVCMIDGTPIGGMLILRDEDIVYWWQGGVKQDVDVPINDILMWHIIREAIDEGYQTYDLMGANTPRICEYKAKFAPDIVTYYSLERAGLLAKTAAEAHLRYRELT